MSYKDTSWSLEEHCRLHSDTPWPWALQPAEILHARTSRYTYRVRMLVNRVSVSSTHCFALHNNPGANCLKGKRLQFQTKSNNINNNNKTKKEMVTYLVILVVSWQFHLMEDSISVSKSNKKKHFKRHSVKYGSFINFCSHPTKHWTLIFPFLIASLNESCGASTSLQELPVAR